jgi:ABC-2 type transport system ATP-binding protein
MLEIVGLQVRYGKREVLAHVSLRVASGEWFCLLGPNGVGKSTLLKCVAGILQPEAGRIRIAGHSLTDNPVAARQALGFASAPEQLPGLLTGRQCLETYAMAKGLQTIDAEVLELANAFAFTRYIDAFVDTYSLGTRQKLSVLLALLGEPQLIVLDEAFNGLDPASALLLKRHLQSRLAAQRCAVLLATHTIDIVEHYAHPAALLLDGRIAREWNGAQISALRQSDDDGFEAAMVAASS